MRNFTNDVIFDDTLPVADGLIEVGARVPLDQLREAMEDWFRRKGYLREGGRLSVEEAAGDEKSHCHPTDGKYPSPDHHSFDL